MSYSNNYQQVYGDGTAKVEDLSWNMSAALKALLIEVEQELLPTQLSFKLEGIEVQETYPSFWRYLLRKPERKYAAIGRLQAGTADGRVVYETKYTTLRPADTLRVPVDASSVPYAPSSFKAG